MSDSESLDYLQPGFDAKSLTIPRLRSILVAHNVPYNSSAKKAQLVDIFNEQVLPQSKKILAARARAKRSSKGIVDAASSQDSNINPFDEPEELAPPARRAASTRRSKSPRKISTRVKTEEPEYESLPPPVPSPTRRSVRASSRPLPTTETETDGFGSMGRQSRRTRTPVPQIKKEESDDGFFRRESGAFSKENPFQSGSSPNEPEPTVSRRRTGGSLGRRSTSIASRKFTDDLDDESSSEEDNQFNQFTQNRMSMPRQLSVPSKKLVRQRTRTPEPSYQESELEPGEEFTPEEQLELASENVFDNDDMAVAPRRPQPVANKTNWGLPLTALFVLMLGIGAVWWREEKVAIGYCGIGQPVGQTANSIPSEIPVPEWAQSVLGTEITVPESLIDRLEPECEPCPAHAFCTGEFPTVSCEPDYIMKPHPFALGGILPFPPTCEPDGEKARRVQAVANRAIDELRQRTAQYECGDLVSEEGAKVESPAIEEQELKEIISKKRSKKMNRQEFEDLWSSAIGEVKEREEVQIEVPVQQEVRDPTTVPTTFFSSTSLARLSLKCQVRRSIRLSMERYRAPAGAMIGLLLMLAYGRYSFRAKRAVNAQVAPLVDTVLARLAGQKQLGEEGLDDESWLFLPNLRDDVLRSVHSLGQREKIWKRVQSVVEQNSNVRTIQRESRSGEVARTWEWIGPLDGAAMGDTSAIVAAARRRRSGRMSFGPGNGEDAKQEEEGTPSRPIY